MSNIPVYPSMVESPIIIVDIGGNTFGTVQKSGTPQSGMSVTYPNFIQDLKIVKVNGTVNTYTLTMVYAIQAGDDPNFMDKAFSQIADTRKITFSYGDCMSPSYIYKTEEAIVTSVKSSINFKSSTITYTVTATSSAFALNSVKYDFPAREAKPSDVIFELLSNPSYGLSQVFYGMSNVAKVRQSNLISTNDKKVKIDAQRQVGVLDYTKYLVQCMSSTTNNTDSPIQDSTYALTMSDEISNDLGGPVFQVQQVPTNVPNANSLETYTVDIGFPGNSFVTEFSVDSSELWSLLYKSSEALQQTQYVYTIDNEGHIVSTYSPNITTSSIRNKTTPALSSWWTQMTQFPVTASLTVKGLIRPAMLMSYVRANVYFYGTKHNTSGLYIITRQEDTINASGYRTTLSLTRIGGDE